MSNVAQNQKKFNPSEHLMSLKGKDYLQVAWRLVWFREDHPNWGLETAALNVDEKGALFCAKIYDENGNLISSGHGSETPRDFGDFIEKAETKAIGRALAMLGYGTQFAGPELDEGERIVDSPIDRGVKVAPVDNSDNIKAWAESHGVTSDEMKSWKAVAIQGNVIPEKGWNEYSLKELMTLYRFIEANREATK